RPPKSPPLPYTTLFRSPQQTVLQFAFRTREVVAMGRLPLPPETPEAEHAAIAQSLARTETSHLEDRTYTQLSGGEQSRVSFARRSEEHTSELQSRFDLV